MDDLVTLGGTPMRRGNVPATKMGPSLHSCISWDEGGGTGEALRRGAQVLSGGDSKQQ